MRPKPVQADDILVPIPYMFTSPHVRKVVDSENIVHETWLAATALAYRRYTHCTSAVWHLVEPINACGNDRPTTCLSCLGSQHGG